jgi:hypothetical protein
MASTFDELETVLQSQGPAKMVDKLCDALRERKDYHGLFYGMLLRKRVDLGLPAVQVGRSEDLPKEVLDPYEDAIRQAARSIGKLFLDEGDIPGAWPFFRMINEPAPVKEAIANVKSDDSEAFQRVLEIAWQEGVHPNVGFDFLLQRFGICSAITTLGQNFPQDPEVRKHCVERLVRALHEELRERVAADIQRREGTAPQVKCVREMIAGHDWLFEDEFAHVDVSHLGAVVQFSIHLPPGEELDLAIDLCEYGVKLPAKMQFGGEPPFDDQYRDYRTYLQALAGANVDEGVAHFQAKAEHAEPEDTMPAEVLINLLVRLNRHRDAVQAYGRYLAQADVRQLSIPSLQELCQKAGDYQPLVEVSIRRGDLVNYAAGLLQVGK